MRDLLTALAGAVILILVAALAVPPFVDWPAHRALVDRTLARSLGVPVRSEGRIEVRLLPSPRLRLDRLHLGDDAAKPALDLRFVKAEMALSPLLTGDVRFTETRIGRAEVKVPVTEGDAILLPADPRETLRGRDLAIEDLQVQQFLLTTLVPATGRTDQLYAEALQVQAPSLAGPWRVAGTSGGLPFRVATGAAAPDGSIAVKLSGGGDTRPRLEADFRLALVPADPRGAEPDAASAPRPLAAEAEGSARLVVGPPTQAAGPYLPVSLGGRFKARGALVRFEGVAAEIDPGGKALRLAGTGQLDLRRWRAGLTLEARRLDLDAFLLSPAGQALVARGLGGDAKGETGLPVMLDLDLSVETAVLGFEEWADIRAAGTLDRTGGLLLRRFSALAPGAATLTASGEIDTRPTPRFTGPVALAAPATDGLGRYLRGLGLDGGPVALLDGRPLEASAEVSVADAAYSLRNLRLALGDAQVTGNARYAPADARARGRFDAQIRARGLDVALLPRLGGLSALRDHDFGLTVEARDLRYGPTGTGNGTLSASIQSDGPSLVVDSLDIADLAGANAKLSGRIGADGAGRVAGRITAPVAAPLLALIDRVFADARMVPAFLRAGALDLGITLERGAGDADALRVAAAGKAAGGTLDLSLVGRAGIVESATLRLATPRAGTWFGRTDVPGLQEPADLGLVATRAATGEGALSFQATGTIAGAEITTTTPIQLAAEGGAPTVGDVRVESDDLGPFLVLAGAAGLPPGPWPADLAVGLARDGDEARVAVQGRVAGAAVDARVTRAPDGALAGTARLGRLSLPALAAALVMPAGAGDRFAPAPPPGPPVSLGLRVERLDLGRGLAAAGAALSLGLEGGTLSLRDLSARLGEGRITGSATVSRRGAAAAISGEGALADAAVPALAGGGPIGGRLSTRLRFSTSGDGPSALAANLAGTGDLTLSTLSVPQADPAAAGRALARALRIEDPLREGRLQALVVEELARAGAGAAGPATAPATLVGGVLRAGPFDLDLGDGHWTGTLGYDVRTGRLDARGTLAGGTAPKGWAAGPPTIQFGLAGPPAAPERTVDAGPLTTGLAALVLQRELETIELFEADQVERQRRRARIEMDRARAAALKAAADRAAAERLAAEKAEEAARQARLKAQAEEAARRSRAETAEPPDAPLDIRPPPAQP